MVVGKEICYLQKMEKFAELSYIIDNYALVAANVLRTPTGRARYHYGMPLNYYTSRGHFPAGARGEGENPDETYLPLGLLPSFFHVLGIDPKEFNSTNATNIVDQKCADNLAMTRNSRSFASSDAMVLGCAFETMCRTDEIKPYEVVGNKKV
jgi:hypothetical protein